MDDMRPALSVDDVVDPAVGGEIGEQLVSFASVRAHRDDPQRPPLPGGLVDIAPDSQGHVLGREAVAFVDDDDAAPGDREVGERRLERVRLLGREAEVRLASKHAAVPVGVFGGGEDCDGLVVEHSYQCYSFPLIPTCPLPYKELKHRTIWIGISAARAFHTVHHERLFQVLSCRGKAGSGDDTG